MRDGRDLPEDWDLDLDDYRRKSDLTATRGREPARLVHKVIFSMPAGTQPDKVLTAVKNFAREEFALKHRYAMALHTDTESPHVHVVIKAVSEQGQRLHIDKATLREWRSGFARQLRALGVRANATPRYARGETGIRKRTGSTGRTYGESQRICESGRKSLRRSWRKGNSGSNLARRTCEKRTRRFNAAGWQLATF